MKDYDILQIQKDRIKKQKQQKALISLFKAFKNINEVTILFVFIILVIITFAVFEGAGLKDITTLSLASVLMFEFICFYPLRFIFRLYNRADKMQINIPNFTSTFWICLSIVLVGFLFCGTYYLTHKDDGRYQYDNGIVIDKKNGTFRPIEKKE